MQIATRKKLHQIFFQRLLKIFHFFDINALLYAISKSYYQTDCCREEPVCVFLIICYNCVSFVTKEVQACAKSYKFCSFFYILCHTYFDKFSEIPNIKSDIFSIFKLHMFHMWPILSHSFLKLINGCFVFCSHHH